MTSEQQRASNRLNAAKSSGPRSSAGRRRASGNSYRHGLAASQPSIGEQTQRFEELAREIAGDTANPVVLQHARAAAQAELDLGQVRRIKVATINQILASGQVGGSPPTDKITMLECPLSERGVVIDDSVPRPPSNEPELTAEAVRRALPELIKLDRYEQNAVMRREQAMRAIYAMHAFDL